jgi:hypothetical protein
VGLIQDIENRLLDLLSRLLQPVVAPLTRLWEILKGFFTAVIDVIPESTELVKLIYSEVLEWKDFRENANFKGGVINLQSTRNKIEDLIAEAVNAWRSLVDLFTHGFRNVTVRPIEEATEALTDVIDAFGSLEKLGLKAWLERIGPTLEKAGGKIFEILAVIQAVAEELLRVVRQLRSIVDFTADVRRTFEEGEGLFLKQTNPRRKIKIAEVSGGGEIKIRLGNLHQ